MRKASTELLEQGIQTEVLRNEPKIVVGEKFRDQSISFCDVAISSDASPHVAKHLGSDCRLVHSTSVSGCNQRRQADLRLGSTGTSEQAARMFEDTVLYRGERMFYRRASQAHHFRSSSLLHALKGILMHVPGNVAPWA